MFVGHCLTCGGAAAMKMTGRHARSAWRSPMIRLPFAPLAAAIVAVGEVAYLVCVAVGALWPSVFGMQTFFPTIFPGFTWLDPFSFVLGLVEVALYGLADRKSVV